MTIVTSCNLDEVPEAVAMLEDVGTLIRCSNDRREVLAAVRDAEVYLGGADVRVDREFLAAAPKLHVIACPATGREHLDWDAIRERGITIFHLAEERELLRSFTAVAEYVFATVLMFDRKLIAAATAARDGRWVGEQFTGQQLSGKTFGVLGLGRLGAIAARIAIGFGMRVVAHDIRDIADVGVQVVGFDTLLRESDILSIHVTLTPETTGMINAAALERMKSSAILVNTSRGPVVDEVALLDALRSGRIRGAILDVLCGEWQPSATLRDYPLIAYAREHDNLLITPHVSSATTESITGARVFMAKKLVAHLTQLAAVTV